MIQKPTTNKSPIHLSFDDASFTEAIPDFSPAALC